ncbi:hypothetical protein IU421_10885 [Nocardia cyriacigeorgica]|uniref:hypothetical protein n=1 Tax=Nocardia cyriacigeorgica TaxID=135487 RepID=UPI001894C0BE|nr:hypothetical protein [Nocardia cyriacigeorgica]MBF6342858.1 hypothetical protein [Nocardia cyriacigeorgica]MBF6514784.1 hypothetical protein [Nocardia cyriacigeorgica]
MTEQQDVIEELDEAGVLSAIRWAYLSATARLLATATDDTAFDDRGWVGYTRFKLFEDRLDRVFACERYSVGSGDRDVALDLLYSQLPKGEAGSMPRLEPGLVTRNNLNLSPGWAFGNKRFLLASAEFGKLRELPWPQKSPTKQKVASQVDPDPAQGALFDYPTDAELRDSGTLLSVETELDMTTFVVGHSLDPLGGNIELGFGRPRLNSGGGQAWLWLENLLALPPSTGGQRADTSPQPTPADVEPDAPVRLRRQGGTLPGENRRSAQ